MHYLSAKAFIRNTLSLIVLIIDSFELCLNIFPLCYYLTR